MSSVILTGDTSGTLTLSAPLVAGTNTLTLAAATGTLSPLVSATAQASTSGTSIDFTGIPSYAKRITVMLNAVSVSGTSVPLIQLGSGSVTTTGYDAVGSGYGVAIGTTTYTTGFGITDASTAAAAFSGMLILTNVSGNIWAASGIFKRTTGVGANAAGVITLSGTIDRVRITTVNGTDTFDAGSINIMYEG